MRGHNVCLALLPLFIWRAISYREFKVKRANSEDLVEVAQCAVSKFNYFWLSTFKC